MKYTFYLSVMVCFLSVSACYKPYSPKTYKGMHVEQKFAVICHNGKQTLKIPAEQWPKHRAHGDYRGPCRAGTQRQRFKQEDAKHTKISYKNAKERSKWSYDQWANAKRREQEILDSLKALEYSHYPK